MHKKVLNKKHWVTLVNYLFLKEKIQGGVYVQWLVWWTITDYLITYGLYYILKIHLGNSIIKL